MNFRQRNAALVLATILFLTCTRRGKPAAADTVWKSNQQSIDYKKTNEDCTNPEPKYFFSHSSTGLGNRLLVMAGSYGYAKLTKRCWIHIWNINKSLSAEFSDLFVNQLNLAKATSNKITINLLNFVPFSEKSIEEKFQDVSSGVEIFSGETFLPPQVNYSSVFFNCVTLPVIQGSCFQQQIAWASEFLRSLEPVAEVVTKVEQLLLPFNNEPFTGIHLRTLSAEVGDQAASIGPTSEAQFKSLFAQIPKGPLNFFVATDSPEMRSLLQAEILNHNQGSKVITTKDTISRSSSDGVVSALIELYALSKAEIIYGTEGSTFSDVAALISKNQRKRGLGPKHIFASSANLRFGFDGKPYLEAPTY